MSPQQPQKVDGLKCPPNRCPPFNSTFLPKGPLPDVAALLALVEQVRPTLLKSGRLPKKFLHRAAERMECEPLWKGWKRYLDFLVTICLEFGLLRIFRRQLMVTSKAESWLARPWPDLMTEIFRWWKESSAWDELYRMAGIRIDSTGLRNSPASARSFVLERLGRLPPNDWVRLLDFVREIQDAERLFYRPLGDERNWRLAALEEAAPLLHLGEGNWWEVEGRLVVTIIVDAAYWLGLTAVGYTQSGEIGSILLTPVGAALLGVADEFPRENHLSCRQIHVQSNFDLLVPSNADLAIRFQVAKFAAWKKTDQFLTFHLTRQSVVSALAKGDSIDQFIVFLERHSRRPLPQNVSYTLQNWATLYGQITLRPAILLETSSTDISEEMPVENSLAFPANRLGEKHFEVEAGAVEGLLAKLEAMGYLPKIDPSLSRKPSEALLANEEELYFLLLGLAVLSDHAPSYGLSPKDPALESLSRKLAQLGPHQILDRVAEDYQSMKKDRARLLRRAAEIINPEAP